MLNGGITITGIPDSFVTNNGNINGNINITGGGNFTFVQNGIFGSTNINATSSGTNALLVNPGRSVAGVTMAGANNTVDNSGTFNTSLQLTATDRNNVINRAGGQFNSVELIAPRNVIDNSGTFNGGMHFTSDSTNTIQNRPTGIINGITATGTSKDQVNNEGQINGSVSLGDGDDWYVNLGRTGPGTLLGNVDLGAGNDILYIENGLVSSPVNLGSGDDWAAVLNGTLSSDLQAGDGADRFYWAGGTITAGVDLGAGDDRADFYSLTQSNLLTGERISGGTGNDTMVWHHTIGDDVYRFVNWELIELSDNSQMIFSNYSTLTMGDSGTGTGTLSIDSTSAVSAGNGTHTVAPAVSGQLVNVYNAGIIDLTNSQQTMTDRFTVVGNYIGVNGNLNLQTYLGDDSSPSDQLVIRGNGARAAGSTLINVTNINGPGAMTTGNGIRVVDADLAGGATTDVGSFSLGSRVAAGIYEYALFRGGVGADAGDNDWYLRSSVFTGIMPTVPVIPPTPPPPPIPAPDPQPAVTLPAPPPPLAPAPPPSTIAPPTILPIPVPPSPLPPVTPAPSPEPLPPAPTEPPAPEPTAPPTETPLIRPEIPGYTIAPAIAHRMGIAALDKFHARQGDQSLLNSYGVVPGAWGRGFGQSADQERSSSIVGHGFQLAPEFDGHIWGLQTGFDLLGRENGDGSQERLGLFYTHMEARGDITGNILAGNHLNAGDLELDGDGIGAYWTHVGSTGWYIDTVGMLNWFDGEADSSYGAGADISGNSVLLSLETGYPFALSGSWTLEPQAQLVWQRVDLDDTHDRFASIAYGAADTWMGRLGLRLESDTTMNEVPVQPFVDINLWHNFSSSYTSKFNDGSLETQMESTSLEVGAGVSTRLSANVSAYAALHYATSVDGDDNRSLGGNIGLLIKW